MGSYFSRPLTLFVLSVFSLLVFPARLQATEISGTISSTLTITENSELVGDVTCMVVGAPCISFGSSGIKLRLNGFTMTGSATDCTAATASTFGIVVTGQHNVAILGPGLVQKFAVFGVALNGANKVRVEGLTASDNCFSGIFLAGTTDSDIEKNVSVRNSIASKGNPCGGT
jgi:parallel beta-helix repeat protein